MKRAISTWLDCIVTNCIKVGAQPWCRGSFNSSCGVCLFGLIHNFVGHNEDVMSI